MPAPRRHRLSVRFYRTDAANEPVRDWLKSLPMEDRRAIGLDLLRVQEDWPVGMPLCRSLGGGIWEVRTNLASRRTARVLFFVDEGEVGVVHGFIKKTRKTPPEDLELAMKRKKEMQA